MSNYCKYKSNSRNNNKSKSKKETKDRTIFLNEEITDDVAKDIVTKLLKFDEENHKTIKLYINSPGGSVSAGFAIYDCINYIKSDVSTIAIGRVASMATIILIGGTKGRRCAFPNSEIMIHEVSSSMLFTKLTEMKERVDHTSILNSRIMRLIVKNTNRTLAQVRKDTVNKDTWYSAQKAKRYDMIDKIL